MIELQTCQCPYCGESIEFAADASAGAQDYIEDCPVCCRPIQIRAQVDDDGAATLLLAREDEA